MQPIAYSRRCSNSLLIRQEQRIAAKSRSYVGRCADRSSRRLCCRCSMSFANPIPPRTNKHSTTNTTMLLVAIGIFSGDFAIKCIWVPQKAKHAWFAAPLMCINKSDGNLFAGRMRWRKLQRQYFISERLQRIGDLPLDVFVWAGVLEGGFADMLAPIGVLIPASCEAKSRSLLP